MPLLIDLIEETPLRSLEFSKTGIIPGMRIYLRLAIKNKSYEAVKYIHVSKDTRSRGYIPVYTDKVKLNFLEYEPLGDDDVIAIVDGIKTYCCQTIKGIK